MNWLLSWVLVALAFPSFALLVSSAPAHSQEPNFHDDWVCQPLPSNASGFRPGFVVPKDSNRGADNSSRSESQFANPKGQSPDQAVNLSDLDGIMEGALRQYNSPGGSLAVAINGRLVYAKGFGFANLDRRERATANTLFNVASVTKTISTIGILTLHDAGKLNLDTPLYDLLGRPPLPRRPDPRMYQVTVRHLLHHSAGWNDDSAYVKAGNAVRRAAPNGMPFADALLYVLSTPLDYDPGTDAKYANGDWNIIKFVIEYVGGQKYGPFMRGILSSIGIDDMKGEHPQYRPGESARYNGWPPRELPGGKTQNIPLEPDFGNWLASAVDMVRILSALDGSLSPRLISPESYAEMLAPLPPPMVNRPNGTHYGLGLDAVRQSADGVFFTKNGGKAGVHAQIEHMPNGVDFAIFFNGGATPDGKMADPLDTALKQVRQTLRSIQQWPSDPIQ
jgi:CubicO group peptidase (beta-lactamase class C family)